MTKPIGDNRYGDVQGYDEEAAAKLNQAAKKGDKQDVTFVNNPLQKKVEKL